MLTKLALITVKNAIKFAEDEFYNALVDNGSDGRSNGDHVKPITVLWIKSLKEAVKLHEEGDNEKLLKAAVDLGNINEISLKRLRTIYTRYQESLTTDDKERAQHLLNLFLATRSRYNLCLATHLRVKLVRKVLMEEDGEGLEAVLFKKPMSNSPVMTIVNLAVYLEEHKDRDEYKDDYEEYKRDLTELFQSFNI